MSSSSVINVLSVGETNRYLRELLESDELLADVWVRGEVSNLSQSISGHLWFTLKDSDAQLRCVVFRGQLPYVGNRPQNGLAVVAHGRVSLYEAGGQVQLYVDLVQPQGMGELYLQFERLRRQLEREGLFSAARKRPLPIFPKRIAVVTSPAGAVLHDILNVVRRRYPSVEVVLAPTVVQGEAAAQSIAATIGLINELEGIDLLILARGGGSLEDLWPFNEEAVARAIFASRVPVVSGVGHETDVTIADLVADLRAPTPSAAAELVVPDRREHLALVAAYRLRLDGAAQATIEAGRNELTRRRAALLEMVPPPRFRQWHQQLDELWGRALTATGHRLALRREKARSAGLQLQALSPLAVLRRGYSICWLLPAGEPVRSKAQVEPGDSLAVQVIDGSFPVVAG
ncbi:MAG: exodeoxyribonuclease VII large subunit [Chloroflexi bacterium]|nr:exodeoxyribonuclease VII large subunit [Chloroflexota bacterium]